MQGSESHTPWYPFMPGRAGCDEDEEHGGGGILGVWQISVSFSR